MAGVLRQNVQNSETQKQKCDMTNFGIHFKKHGILTGFTGFTGC